MPQIKAKLLDTRQDGTSKCFLSKFSLYDYLSNLPENYHDYDIQREFVSSNVYLDKIIDTVLSKFHIPNIVIVLEKFEINNEYIEFDRDKYKIIDGLQRTHRLKIIFDTFILFKTSLESNEQILGLPQFQLLKKYSSKLLEIKSNYKILSKIMKFYRENGNDISSIENVFLENYLWFELWTNLDSKKQVEKMLLLNAGHKPVKLKHQLELLFINDLLIEFKKNDKLKDFKLIREKEMNSSSFSKIRKYGEFHFSQLITSLVAFDTGKIVVTNANLISKIQEEDYTIQDLSNELSYDFITVFITFLLDFDKIIDNRYRTELKWFGRETSLIGLFAALGKYRIEKEVENPQLIFDELISYLNRFPNYLNLGEFDSGRKSLDFSKINFGNINKKVVFNAFWDLLKKIDNPSLFENEEAINWGMYFELAIKTR